MAHRAEKNRLRHGFAKALRPVFKSTHNKREPYQRRERGLVAADIVWHAPKRATWRPRHT